MATKTWRTAKLLSTQPKPPRQRDGERPSAKGTAQNCPALLTAWGSSPPSKSKAAPCAQGQTLLGGRSTFIGHQHLPASKHCRVPHRCSESPGTTQADPNTLCPWCDLFCGAWAQHWGVPIPVPICGPHGTQPEHGLCYGTATDLRLRRKGDKQRSRPPEAQPGRRPRGDGHGDVLLGGLSAGTRDSTPGWGHTGFITARKGLHSKRAIDRFIFCKNNKLPLPSITPHGRAEGR